MLNRKYIKLTLSTSLLGLLLFLSCDDRNPVSTPAPVILNELNLNIRNASCTGEDGEELKQYLKDLQEDEQESEEVVEGLEGEKPFYKTTLGMIAISVVVLVILVLVLKYTGIFDITELMNFF